MDLRKNFPRLQSLQAKNTFTLLTGSTAGQLIALIAYPVITRLYTPAEFGTQSVFMTLGLLLSVVATGRFEQSLLLPRKHDKAGHIFLLILFLSSLFSLILFLPCLLWKTSLAHLLGSDALIHWMPLLPFYTWLMAVSSAMLVYANRFAFFRTMATYQIVQSGGNAGFRIGLSGQGGGGLIVGTILGQLAGFIALGIPLFRKANMLASPVKTTEIKEVTREYLNFPKYKMPGVFMGYLSGNLPIFALSSFFSPAISGLYALAFGTVFRPLNLFINSISQVFAQQFILHHNEGKPLMAELNKFIKRLLLIGTGPFVLAFAFAPWLFSLIFGSEWETAGTYLRWMLPWLFLIYLYSGLNFIPDMFGKQGRALTIDFSLLVLRIIVLGIGILTKNAFLTVILFSLSGVIVPSISLYWYIYLVKKSDKEIYQ
jgi:lipopolysaccharide exporter